MKNIKKDKRSLNVRISESYDRIDQVRDEKLVHLFIKIIVASTLKEFYEKSNKISKIQSDWAE